MKKPKSRLFNPYLVLALAILFMICSSPKWTLVIAPWLGLFFMLHFFRGVKFGKALGLGYLGLFIACTISNYEVVPIPMPFYLIFAVLASAKALLPYLLDRFTRAADRGFVGTLIFPAAFVSLEFLDSLSGGNTWGAVGHTQYRFLALQQIASVFGVWGISFLVYWFASLLNWVITNQGAWPKVKTGVITASSIYLLVLAFGILRISFHQNQNTETITIGGVTLDNTNLMETLYQEEFGKPIQISLETSQVSPQLKEAGRAMPPFIENPLAAKYESSRKVMRDNINQLFRKTQELADKGAKIIAWSEAIGFILDQDEPTIIKRAQQLAKDKNIYLLMGLGVLHPGPIDEDRLILINKAVTVNPQGELVNTYLKSNPVPFAEQDYGSDDIIPLIETPFGNISPVICYDADFNPFMQQTGRLGTDILFVPSGDWKAIASYHSYMAVLRGIENGVSVVRPVSRGLSLATDPYGNLLASDNFFDSEEKAFLAQVPTSGISTIYNTIGDVLGYVCFALVLFFAGAEGYKKIRKRLNGAV